MFDTLVLGNRLQASSTLGGLLIVAGVLVLTSRLHVAEGPPLRKDRDREKTPEREVSFSKTS